MSTLDVIEEMNDKIEQLGPLTKETCQKNMDIVRGAIASLEKCPADKLRDDMLQATREQLVATFQVCAWKAKSE